MPTAETNRSKVIRRLEKEGWELRRHGSDHDVYSHAERKGRLIVPRHKTLSSGVARSIAKAAGWM